MVAVRGQAPCLAGFRSCLAGLSPRVQLPPNPVRGKGRQPMQTNERKIMKKLVPDPPAKVLSQPFYTINKDMPSHEALLYVIQLLRGIEDTLDEYICGNAGEPGIGILVNSVHNVQMGRALAELVLTREAGEITWH